MRPTRERHAGGRVVASPAQLGRVPSGWSFRTGPQGREGPTRVGWSTPALAPEDLSSTSKSDVGRAHRLGAAPLGRPPGEALQPCRVVRSLRRWYRAVWWTPQSRRDNVDKSPGK